jgi:hypothetical protein
MAGYVPLFDSLTKGTLCGKWPDIGLWPIVLSLSDKNGVVDCTPDYIAGVTGMTIDDVSACMDRFCAPDPKSRSAAAGGARLVLLDEHRQWGWQVVNHSSYREKARKQMQQNQATESGRDAERKRLEREKSGGVQSRPAVSGADRPSDADADSDSSVVKTRASGLTPEAEMAIPLRDLGVKVTSMHPTLEAWIRDGFTLPQLRDAVERARETVKPPLEIAANYLDRVLRNPPRGPPERQRAKGAYERLMEANSGD